MRRSFGLAAIAAFGFSTSAIAQTAAKQVYIAPDDHTDYMWSANEAQYSSYFPRALDAYLDQIDQTATDPTGFQARWNTDGSLWMWEYERQRTPAQMTRLMDRVRDGHVSMPLNGLVEVNGATPVEAVIRDMYYAGRLERRFNVRFPLAIAMENQTASLGLGSVFAGAGARYSWKGVCDCATNVRQSGNREIPAYWWTGKDNSRLLTKWMDFEQRAPGASGANQGPGGYAEARFPNYIVPYVTTNAGFRTNWPYDVIGLIGQGWDDVESIIPLSSNESFPGVARRFTNASRNVLVSNTEDFFKTFETRYGAALPSQSVSFGNEWEVCTAAFSEKAARLKRALEKLRGAEAMATLVGLTNPARLTDRTVARDAAFRDFGLFFEHNVCGGGPGVPTPDRTAYQERKAASIEAYVDGLHAEARSALAALMPRGTRPRFFVFNPMGFNYSSVAEIAYPGTGPFSVYDLRSGRSTTPIAAQAVGSGADRRIRFVAQLVPGVGYSLFEVRDTAPAAPFPDVATQLDATTIQTSLYTLSLDGRGAITSLIERQRNNRQWVRRSGDLALNDLGEGSGTVTLEANGPVFATLRADVTGPVPRTVRVTLSAGMTPIEIEDTINAAFADTKSYAFSLAIDNPVVRHEEVGAVLTAKLAPAGDYSPRSENSQYKWLTMNHFADMSTAAGDVGMTIANRDAYFMRLGDSQFDALDVTTPRIDVLAGGRGAVGESIALIPNQADDPVLTHRFALIPHGAYNQGYSMRTSLAATNPVITGAVTGPTSGARLPSVSFAFARSANVDAVLWTLKPAEEGIGAGAIARFWNQGNASIDPKLVLNQRFKLAERRRTSSVETDLAAGDPIAAPDPQRLRAQQIGTFRLRLTR